MLTCLLRKTGGQDFSLGKVSHCLHGLVDQASGLKFLRLEILLLWDGTDARGVEGKLSDAQFPVVDKPLDFLVLQHSPNHLTHVLTTTAKDAGGAGGWKWMTTQCYPFHIEHSTQAWKKGIWLTFVLQPQSDANGNSPLFRTKRNLQVMPGAPANPEAVFHPFNVKSPLSEAECKHGYSLFGGVVPPAGDGGPNPAAGVAPANPPVATNAWEFLRDSERSEVNFHAAKVVQRYEKDRTQTNAHLDDAFAIAEDCRTRNAGNRTLTFSEPNNAETPASRKLDAARTQHALHFSYAGGAPSLFRLHFLEYSGLFRGRLQMPPLAAYRDANSDIFEKKDYWLDQLANLSLDGPAVDQGIPREVITIVTK